MSKNNYNSNHRSDRKKNGFLRFIKVVCFILATAAIAAAMVFAFGGLSFTNPFKKELNSDNLLSYKDYDKDQMLMETGYGIDVKWKEDGSIVINGKNEDPSVEENLVKEYIFTSVTLDAGTYTLSGYDKGQLNTLGLFASVPGDQTYYATSGKSFTLQDTTVVSIGFYVGNDKTFVSQRLYPTLVKGDTAGSFFVD